MQDVTWAIATGLARRKHAVTVITTRVPGEPERFERDGVEVCGPAGTEPELAHDSSTNSLIRRYRAVQGSDPGSGPRDPQ